MSYDERHLNELRRWGFQSTDDLRRLPSFPPEIQKEVLEYCAELAFMCQHYDNILLGQASLRAIPAEWLMERLEEAFAIPLATNDDYEYGQMAGFLEDFDSGALSQFLEHCRTNPNPHVRELADAYEAESKVSGTAGASAFSKMNPGGGGAPL